MAIGRTGRGVCTGLLCLAAYLTPAGEAGSHKRYREEILEWRESREARLKADGGWLTVAGLFWLHPESNRFGTDSSNDIVLPAGTTAPFAGSFDLEDGRTTFRMDPGGVPATVDGETVTEKELRPDTSGSPDIVSIGDRLTLHIIERDGRYGVRLKDMQSETRKRFTGLEWFPVKEPLRVTARFVPHDPPRQISVPNILGTISDRRSPGYVIFEVGGQELRLDPVASEEATQLFFIFGDQTNGKETYAAGRFLYSGMPEDGRVVLDFNKTYNPPCAFTPYATCPLPPRQNRLEARIEAGELNYGEHH